MGMTANDGTVLPKPVRRARHEYGFYKSSEGRNVCASVVEIEHPGLLTLAIVEQTEDWEFLALEYLTAIAAARIAEGWTILSAADRHIILGKRP